MEVYKEKVEIWRNAARSGDVYYVESKNINKAAYVNRKRCEASMTRSNKYENWI